MLDTIDTINTWKERFQLVTVQHTTNNSTVYKRPLQLEYTTACGLGRLVLLVKDMTAMELFPSLEYNAEKGELTVVISNTEEGLKSKALLSALLKREI